MTTSYTTNRIRQYRREIRAIEENIAVFAEDLAAHMPDDESMHNAERYEDGRAEMLQLERDCLAYAVRGIVSPPGVRTFADLKYAADLALGEYDDTDEIS